MKKLIISMKSTDDIFADFKKTAQGVKKGKSPKNTHYEIAFESEKDFNRFVRNMPILMAILNARPHSVYQLAKITNRDLANVKKVIIFFEELGAISIKEETVSGRRVKKPVVDYDRIEFNLKAA